MRKFFNQKERKIKKYENYDTFILELNEDKIEGLEHYVKTDNQMREFILKKEKEQINKERPVLFIISINLDILSSFLEPEARNEYLTTLINIFVSNLFNQEATGQEYRLSSPKFLEKTLFNKMVGKDLMNKKLKFPIFSVMIKSINEIDKDWKKEAI